MNVERSWGPAGVAGEEGFYAEQEVRLRELLVGSLVGPDGVQAELVAILEPGGDLLVGGLLEVGGECGLAGGGGGAGQNVAAGVRRSREAGKEGCG